MKTTFHQNMNQNMMMTGCDSMMCMMDMAY